MLYFALHALQHRGQESAGIAAIDGKKMIQYKNLGLVSEVFNPQSIAEFKVKKLPSAMSGILQRAAIR